MTRRRYALVGAGGRARALVTDNADYAELVALADVNPVRIAAHNRDAAAAEAGQYTLMVRPYWQPPQQVDVPGYTRGGHGGADARMTRVLFGDRGRLPDELGRAATERDGATSLLVGLAGNESMRTGAPVRVADVLDIGEPGVR